jgi:hypothetical protein
MATRSPDVPGEVTRRIWGIVLVGSMLFSASGVLLAAPKGGTCMYTWRRVSDFSILSNGVSAHVWDLAVAPEGTPLGPAVFACGNFEFADGIAVHHIAKWNGSHWSPLTGPSGNGLNEVCQTLALGPDGKLYAGGLFTTAGGVNVSGIARWDGSTWSALGSGATSGFLREDGVEVGNVYGLSFYDGGWGPGVSGDTWLLAGGNFAYAFPAPAGESANLHNLARWDGTAWHRLGTFPDDGVEGHDPFTGGPQVSDFLEVDFGLGLGPSLYLAGVFSSAGGAPASSTARWDGGFSPLGSGLRVDLSNSPGNAQAMASFQGQLYVGGEFDHAGSTFARHVARWDGSAWSWPGGPAVKEGYIEGLRTVNLGNGAQLYAAGFFLDLVNPDASHILARHIARFDGVKWTKLGGGLGPDTGDGVGDDRIHGMVMADRIEADGHCLYVGGSFDWVGPNLTASNIARWCCKKWPYSASELLNAYPVNAGIPFSFTDSDGDGLPESIACDDDREIPVFPGTEMEACGLHFVFGTSRGDDLHLETSTLPVVAFGGPGRNDITGSRFDDMIFGGSDDDTLSGGGGDDQLYAGFGDDVLLGELGDDRLVAGPGDDRLDSGAGFNAVDGGDGADTAVIQPGDEVVDLESVTVLGAGGPARARRR